MWLTLLWRWWESIFSSTFSRYWIKTRLLNLKLKRHFINQKILKALMMCKALSGVQMEATIYIEMHPHINTNSANWGPRPTSDYDEPTRLLRVGWMSWSQIISIWMPLDTALTMSEGQVLRKARQSLFLPLSCIGPYRLKKNKELLFTPTLQLP